MYGDFDITQEEGSFKQTKRPMFYEADIITRTIIKIVNHITLQNMHSLSTMKISKKAAIFCIYIK